jgi:dihydrofolate reductase
MITGHVFIATSLDGFISTPDGGIEWLIRRDDPNEDHGYNDFIRDIDGLIMGRGTYEKAITFDSWQYTIPVLVMSKTLKSKDIPISLKDKIQIVDSSPRDLMRSLDYKGWKKVYVDGGQIIQSFLRDNLIADMVITTAPVLLGEGRNLFGTLNSETSLTHIKTTAFPSGLVQSKYRIGEK